MLNGNVPHGNIPKNACELKELLGISDVMVLQLVLSGVWVSWMPSEPSLTPLLGIGGTSLGSLLPWAREGNIPCCEKAVLS